MKKTYFIIEVTKIVDYYYKLWGDGFIFHRGRSLDKGFLSPSCIKEKMHFLEYMIDFYKGKHKGAQKMWLFKTHSSALKVANDYRMKHIVQETKIHKVTLDLEEGIIYD